jgi:nickel transport protein
MSCQAFQPLSGLLSGLLAHCVSPVLVAGIALCATAAQAHDAWIAPTSGPVYPVHSGHKDPAPFPGSKVQAVRVLDSQQNELPASIAAGATGADVTVSGAPAMLLVFFDNGFWVKEPSGSRNVSKLESTSATSGSRPLKWGKTITQWTAWSGMPMGQRIEIVPVGISVAPKAGSKLTVQVLLNGKPLPGVMVENNSNETGPTTDASGFATLTLTSGQQRIAIDHDVPVKNDPKTDKLVLNASLVFVAQ